MREGSYPEGGHIMIQIYSDTPTQEPLGSCLGLRFNGFLISNHKQGYLMVSRKLCVVAPSQSGLGLLSDIVPGLMLQQVLQMHNVRL